MTRPSELSTSAALLRVLREAPALQRGLVVTVLLAAAGTSIQIAVPIVIQMIVDNEILNPDGVDVGAVLRLGAIAVAAMAVAMIVRRLALVRLTVRAAEGLSDLRVKTFAHLHDLSVLHVESERRGALVARVTSDIVAIQDFVDWGGVGLLIGVAQVMLALGAMLYYQWDLALMVLAGVVVYAAMLIWFQRILQKMHNQVRAKVANSLAAMSEVISGLPVVRAYGGEAATQRKIDVVFDEEFKAEVRTFAIGSAMFSSAEIFAGAITAAVIGVGILTGVNNGLSAGTLLAMLFLVNLLVEPVQTLVETLDQAQSAAAGVRRVVDVLDTPVDVPDPVDGVDLPDGSLDVAFDHVGFRYPTGGDVLTDVTIDIPAEARVAVVGETGSGKSTFTKLLTRLLDPAAGTVSIGGVPLSQVRFASLRRHVVFVPQEGFLFDASIADNVRYGKPEATDEEVAAAFTDLSLDDWIAGLSDGLDTAVGERGGQLSAGERQLVALARAWIAAPGVLVLDEATSAVDPVLEVSIRRAMERITEGRTSITVAHRLSTAEAADFTLVFDQGRLVEFGPHAELVARNGVYAALHADWMAGTAM